MNAIPNGDGTYRVREFKLAIIRECTLPSIDMDTPEKAANFWREHVTAAPWFNGEQECFHVFFVNTRRRITGFTLVSIGTADTILVHPREVFRAAIAAGAQAIIMTHNHPSGDPTPSEADIKVTRDLIRAGQNLKIDVLDHVVMGKPGVAAAGHPGFMSLRELGYFYS